MSALLHSSKLLHDVVRTATPDEKGLAAMMIPVFSGAMDWTHAVRPYCCYRLLIWPELPKLRRDTDDHYSLNSPRALIRNRAIPNLIDTLAAASIVTSGRARSSARGPRFLKLDPGFDGSYIRT